MSRKHLDLTDRCVAEKGLVLEQSFRETASSLDPFIFPMKKQRN